MKQQKDNSIDEIDQMLYNYFSNKEIPQKTAELIKSAPHKKRKKQFSITKVVAIILLCVTMTTTGIVFAKDIIQYIKEIFELNSININNQSVTDAIENKGYIQNVDMQYIYLNDKYSIKIDYLMMDDINLYVVFNLYSKEKIEANYRISMLDLKISDDNNATIYDATKTRNDTDLISVPGWKKIEDQNMYEKKELLFLISNGIPITSKLKFEFSNIILYDDNKPEEDKIEINCKCNVYIDIIEKFINREIYEFDKIQSNEEYKITKVVATETGTYLILETSNPEVELKLKYRNNTYQPIKTLLGINTKNNYEFMIQYNITKNEFNLDSILTVEDNSGKTILIE